MEKWHITLVAAIVAGMLCSCDDSFIYDSATSSLKVFEGDRAYMVVKLSEVGSSTRTATSPTDDPFEYGTDEQAVSTAHFYFYDDSGVYVAQATVWDGGTASEHYDETPDDNVEFKGNTVVVLDHLTGVGYPKYMVTVLNQPVDFHPGETLDEMRTLLCDSVAVGIRKGGTGSDADNFVMSTSSFGGQTDVDGQYMPYFVTEVKEENFSLEPIEYDASGHVIGINPVEVYVERLAVKVTLDISDDLAETVTTGGLYPITVEMGTTTETGDPNVTAEQQLYVKINGWMLNCTARHSYMMKNIYEPWMPYDLGFVWNDPDNFRSYWCMSFNYSRWDVAYPYFSYGATDATESSEYGRLWLNKYLRYYSYNDATNEVGTSDYCAENTNTAGRSYTLSTVSGYIIWDKHCSAITDVVIGATVCDENGEGIDMVLYRGLYYTKTDYIKYVLKELQQEGLLNAYYISEQTDEETTYKQIDETLVDWYSGLPNFTDGNFFLALNEVGQETQFYTPTTVGDETEWTELSTDDINEVIMTFITSNPDDNYNYTWDVPKAYNGGMMYYSIPIEHLNNWYKGVYNTYGDEEIMEGNYGVVRNHHYNLTVNSIANLGFGVFNPDEVIVPYPGESDYYYMDVTVDVLPWRVVEEEVVFELE